MWNHPGQDHPSGQKLYSTIPHAAACAYTARRYIFVTCGFVTCVQNRRGAEGPKEFIFPVDATSDFPEQGLPTGLT